MYQQNLQAMTNKVLYKELLAREVQANKVLDNHAAEMQQYEKNIIDAILGWIKMNGNPEIDAMMSIMERELGLGYNKVSRDLQGMINTKVNQEIADRMPAIQNRVELQLHEQKNIFKQFLGERKYIKFQNSK